MPPVLAPALALTRAHTSITPQSPELASAGRTKRVTSGRAMGVREAKLAASEAQRAATQQHLDGRRARQEAHAAALAAALARVPCGRATGAVAELTRQLAEAQRQVAAHRPAMLPAAAAPAAPAALPSPGADGVRGW